MTDDAQYQGTTMKASFCLLLGLVLTFLPGCASPKRGAAYGREPEIRQQLAKSRPVKDYGYVIKLGVCADGGRVRTLSRLERAALLHARHCEYAVRFRHRESARQAIMSRIAPP
jgi:hypothetical protein